MTINQFKKKMITMYGNEGEQWLNSLPQLVQKYVTTWNLSTLEPVAELSMNYVLRGMQKNKPIILKIGIEQKGITLEAAALHYFNGKGCIPVLAEDLEHGALLIHCATPGINVKSMFPQHDRKATEIAATVIKQLQSSPVPEKDAFPSLANWLSYLDKQWEIPHHHQRQAQRLRDHLLSTTTTTVLLHGDLHHSNILSDETSWIAIDPKGVIGDPTYEVNCFIRNPLPELVHYPEIANIIKNRVEDFAKLLGFDRQRMIAWSYVQSVVSACWMIENNGDPSVSIKLADIVEQLMV